jgi:hypothetical protein
MRPGWVTARSCQTSARKARSASRARARLADATGRHRRTGYD